MSTSINTNISALAAQSSLRKTGLTQATSMERLSTGIRINDAKDDAAGLAISTRMTANIRGISAAIRNANDGISLTQTAEGSLTAIGDNLQRIRELAVQASNTGNNTSDRQALNAEATQLVAEIDRVANNSTFNGIKLLDGSFQNQSLQVGAGNDANDRITVSISSAKAASIGIGTSSSYTSNIAGAALTSGTALTSGGITINGVNVGASLSDGVSTVNSTGSALAKANAINAVAGSSGVTAEVQATTRTLTASAAGGAYSLNVNGVVVSGVASSSTGIAEQQTVKVTGTTSSTIVPTVSTVAGTDNSKQVSTVTFQALATGQSVTVAGLTFTAGSDGISAANLQKAYGAAAAGDAFGAATAKLAAANVTTAMGAFTAGQAIAGGAFAASNGVWTAAATGATAISLGTPAGTGEVSLLGVRSVSSVSGSNAAAIRTAILSDKTAILAGTAATAAGIIEIEAGTAADELVFTYRAGSTGNGLGDVAVLSSATSAGITFGTAVETRKGVVQTTTSTAQGNASEIAAALNAAKDLTGVSAKVDGTSGNYILSAADGRNITVTTTTAEAGSTGVANGTITTYGSLKLSSTSPNGIVLGGLQATTAIVGANAQTAASTQVQAGGVSSVDLSTALGAQSALTILDKAIDTITNSRAAMGAYQNRLTASISNLETTSMNLQASRSRILDTDYAKETTNLAKSQIITQAATAMLAQANQSAQSVLALLK
jgi:flagellin